MFSFFYNILTTLTGGKSFEQLSRTSMRKVRATLDGDKLSDIDTRVFASVLKRQKNESFFAYLDRKSKLSKLRLEDKQRLIESEKKRLIAEEKRKRAMLDDYVSGTPPNRTASQVHSDEIRDQVRDTMSHRLSPLDASTFDSLASRKEAEPLFTYLKRSKAMYALPIDEKRQIIDAENVRAKQEKDNQQRMLQEYLKPSYAETLSDIKNTVSESTDTAMSVSNQTQSQVKKSKGISR